MFDAYFDDAKPDSYTKEVRAKFDALDRQMFDPEHYATYWRTNKKLWGMPDLDDVIDGRVKNVSLGGIIQLLWQTVELQAIHTAELARRRPA